ncbi:MAG: carbamoyl-phosphate synthase large subunit [Planctomycetota bacterium]
MPKRTDLETILIIGAGPIIIGQACEFDYSGTQAVKALKEEGYRVILINSNPATIMTDPEMADRTYVEPVTPAVLAAIIEVEGPDALLPTLGGQTGLNTAVAVAKAGVLEKYGCEMIGASLDVIEKAEDRDLFRKAMRNVGLDVPRSEIAHNLQEALEARDVVGLPCIIRPAFTLGGTGGGVVYNVTEFEKQVRLGLAASPISEILIEESLLGWKEYELEVMRDKADNVVIICSIENIDPMGVHTGDSITVAPAQTLTDKEYQLMRDAAIAVIREIGVETGGSNIQFAVDPWTGRMVVIEMNPRVSRSSALASKATGFPIAKFAAKLAVGYTLDEIPNDITKETPASFEPTIDYVVVKIPRFTFEKFPQAEDILGVQMKSVGEVMSIGRTFKEAFQKGLRSLETGRTGFGGAAVDIEDFRNRPEDLNRYLVKPNADRMDYIRAAFMFGMSAGEIREITGMDPWFLANMEQIVEFEKGLSAFESLDSVSSEVLREAKRLGFGDRQIADIFQTDETTVRKYRFALGVLPTYKLVDTCAAEFEAYTPYYYSTYEEECEMRIADRPMVVILGGGPNRIGQGIEFDYCCCHAAFALRELGYETVMVNSNPETVSTDYDTSDHLYFEPLTHEDVLNLCERLKPVGVIVQFGGQTPLNLAKGLAEAGVPIAGTPVEAIEAAEDREKFQVLLERVDLVQPPNGTAINEEGALAVARRIGYPVVVRPSFVLGGRAMEICFDDESLIRYMREAVIASPDAPILIDHFLEDAVEIDVDCISDGKDVIIAAVMEHIEEAGVHSGDSSCSIPPFSLSDAVVERIEEATRTLALALGVCGLMNMQYAVKDDVIYVLEANPRASRTVPYVSKATGVPYAKIAAKVMLGRTLSELGDIAPPRLKHISVKKSVFPFSRFPGTDIILGPEMKSTGEVMGIDLDFGMAFAKAQDAAGDPLPTSGNVFISVKDSDKRAIIYIAKKLAFIGFGILATDGTYKILRRNGIKMARRVNKIAEGRPNVVDHIVNGEIQLVINTPSGKDPWADEAVIRKHTVTHRIPAFTTITAAQAAVNGIESQIQSRLTVKPLQEYYKTMVPAEKSLPAV